MREDGRHGDEGEARTGSRIQPKGKDRRHDHEAAHDGGDHGKEGNPGAGAEHVGLVIQVAAVRHHAAAAHAEREECEAHGLQERGEGEGLRVKLEEELHAGPCSGKHESADDDGEHHEEKERHQDLAHALNALCDVEGHNQTVEEQKEPLKAERQHGVGGEFAKVGSELRLVGDQSLSHQRFAEVRQGPAADGGIKGEHQETGQNAQIPCRQKGRSG